jgi:hypothetical protein
LADATRPRGKFAFGKSNLAQLKPDWFLPHQRRLF